MNKIALEDARYPACVKKVMGARAPKNLDTLGNLDILNMPGVGFSGSRRATQKGLELAEDYAEKVVERNFSVVSGYAGGIDLRAHYACLKAGGNTILVLAEGIDSFYLKKDLQFIWDWDRVLVISQFASGQPWQAHRAMTRNKLIVALSKAVFAFEPGATGGTLDAGKQALLAEVPLFISESDAPGNKILLTRGARELTEQAIDTPMPL